MPCFKGLAVSIHTSEGAISEYSIQKQSRAARISTYIPVPPAKIPTDSITGKPEQSTFAVSITLLTPGLKVPYSAPKPTVDDPYPRGVTVGGLPGTFGTRGSFGPVVAPYIPRTTSPNETLAAYIYFDGRAKEEVATLLRRGEETWVNSRWVSVPDTEGGGLAEREFLFREVGLERWLNGLDLVGKDKAAKIERRHQRLEKRRRMKREAENDSDDEAERKPRLDRNGVLKYGNDNTAPTESVNDDKDWLLSDDSSDDEPPQPEAAGQIKVALFRVLASGEIKRGEYEPQFDAHDDEGEQNDGGNDEDIDHTTTFAKPKTLDPKSISTQTVTGIDPPDSPYAVFTFFYRGEKQLQKMGMLETPQVQKSPTITTKRKSTDFTKLGSLSKFGTVGFSSYRETATPRKKSSRSKADEDVMDSDPDDDDERPAKELEEGEVEEGEVHEHNGDLLSPEDARKQGELADGVRKIKLKRAHSSEAVNDTRKSPYLTGADSPTIGTPQSGNSMAATAGTPPEQAKAEGQEMGVTSPHKRQRASIDGLDSTILPPLDTAHGSASVTNGHVQSMTTASAPTSVISAVQQAPTTITAIDEDEEL